MVAIVVASIGAGPSYSAPRGGFADFAGSWSGSGRVDSAGGSETIRCRARYGVADGGTRVEQHLVCASASYQFDIECRASEAGGRVSGSWSETTRNVSGTLAGTLDGGRLQAVVTAPIFSAGLSLVARGNTQEVVITPQGNDVRQVSIRLRRG
ncbi:hypothetical protein [Methylobacterium sp. C1]|uniref:hypothetical protein n=1 Tax=Methylobacterium sp. C1 TaxID=1479019 RepID=UPI001331B8F8|nr:hypothetical protein [Methylobacterium sp. C1]